MARGTTTSASQRQNRTIILAISQEQYDRILGYPAEFRHWVDENYGWHPELFPVEMKQGDILNGTRTDEKLGLVIRRIRFSQSLCYSIWPSFAMPYTTALTKDVEHGLRQLVGIEIQPITQNV